MEHITYFMLHGFKAKQSLGQNFLVNKGIIDKIVAASEVGPDDTVLEVGPGTGNLTKKLAEKAKRVVAIEKDHRLIPQLLNLKPQLHNIEIIEEDILKFNPSFMFHDSSYKVVGNIPYYITSHLLRTIFESAGWRTVRPKLIVLTIQKEVAQRIMAKPPHMNLLALSVQYYSEPEIVSYVSAGSFRPIPKVDSAIIKLRPNRGIWNMEHGTEKRLFELIRAGFSGKRKQLAVNISKTLKVGKEEIVNILEKNGIPPNARAENLSLNQWQQIYNALKSNV